MKLHIIVAGWIYSCRQPWAALVELKRLSNATVVAFVDNPTSVAEWKSTVHPEVSIEMSHEQMHDGIKTVIPWIHFRGKEAYFLQDEACCHTPYILYRRYEAMKRLTNVNGNANAQILVLRPDSVFDPPTMYAQLRHQHEAVTHAASFSSEQGGYACPQSVNDQWLFGPFNAVQKVLLAFENLAEWHKEWERDPQFVRWWTVGNRVPPHKFFLNAEGIVGKMLQRTNQTCRTDTRLQVKNVKACALNLKKRLESLGSVSEH